mgnify:CR=1 FL=1
MGNESDESKGFWDWHRFIHPPRKIVFEGWWFCVPLFLGVTSWYIGLRSEEIEGRFGDFFGGMIVRFGVPLLWYMVIGIFDRGRPSG